MFNSDVIIKGGAFREPTTLSGILEKRLNIIYGRNGSGKSTIARAFREQLPERQAISPGRDYSLSFDKNGSLDPSVCEHIFVFNEDFINDNIRIKGGLKSIIRIGTSAELDAPIQETKDKIKVYRDKLNPIKEELRTLDGNASTAGSIAETEKILREELKKKGGFSERLFKIEGKNTNLTQTILGSICSIAKDDKLPDSISAMALHLDKSIERYIALKSASNVIWQCPDLDQLPDIAIVNDILEKKVRPSDLTDEEQIILDELSDLLSSEDIFAKTEKLIINSSSSFCPLCHQPLSVHYKDILKDRLATFRDKTVQDYKDAVYNILNKVVCVDSNLPSFLTNKYDQDLDNAAKKLQTVNAFIANIKIALESKAINPIADVDLINKEDYDTSIAECRAALSIVSDDVEDYNKTLNDERAILKLEIDKLNIQLAYHENKSLIDRFNLLKTRKDDLTSSALELEGKIKDQQDTLNSLTAKINQIDDAREQINKYLDFIFGVNKLRLVSEGKDLYKLQIKQDDTYDDLPPKAVSSGERNALALAYFFACVMEKKDKNYSYDDPTLLVIDDPVSSFDSENKAGVLSLLINQIKKVLWGNPKSKVLVLTHDLTTLRELCDHRSHMFPHNNFETETFSRIRYDHKFIRGESCSRILENMEYGGDLWNIFFFATRDNLDNFEGIEGIGNTIRRFAESYASRMYKCSWHELFSEEKYLSCLPDSCKENISNYAIRSVLNSESHGSSDEFSPVEIQRTARALLTYIFYADEKHLRAYLVGLKPENESRITTIKGWFGEP